MSYPLKEEHDFENRQFVMMFSLSNILTTENHVGQPENQNEQSQSTHSQIEQLELTNPMRNTSSAIVPWQLQNWQNIQS